MDYMQKSIMHSAYLGTEIDEKWWRRYKKQGFFMRGNGEFRAEENGLSFRRALTKDPLLIPYDKMTGLSFGKWHSGRWLLGAPILKIKWTEDGKNLCSGFYFKMPENAVQEIARHLQNKIDGAA